MVKTGKLSNDEKGRIQTLISEQKDIPEISKALDRSEGVVSNYVNGELDTLINTIVKVKLERVERELQEQQEEEQINVEGIATDEIIKKVKKRLDHAGMNEVTYNKLIKISLEKFAKAKKTFADDDQLYAECIKYMGAGDMMSRKTQKGREGVAIMTPGASSKADDLRRRAGFNTSRTARNNVFHPND